MDRREALKFLGTALSLPVLANLSGEEIFSFGREMHARLPEAGEGLYVFKTLNPHQNQTVTVITDLILPATDTPGAVAARVNEFIDLMLAEWFKAEERDSFQQGLAELDRQSRSSYGKHFINCSHDQQVELLKSQEKEASATAKAKAGEQEMSWGRVSPPRDHFFHAIKWLTLLGYYTSEIGMLEELGWEMIPGSYSGCSHT